MNIEPQTLELAADLVKAVKSEPMLAVPPPPVDCPALALAILAQTAIVLYDRDKLAQDEQVLAILQAQYAANC